MSRCDCCGCVIESDLGTSVVSGTGLTSDPYIVAIADPSWKRLSARVRRSTDQSVVTGDAFTAISFDTEVFDVGGFWTIASPTLITIPEDGIYLFGGCGLWQANATGTRELGFRRGGTEILLFNDQPVDALSAGAGHWSEITYQYRLGAGEILELVARQESGITLNMVAEADDSIVFWILYMGRVT